jgi:hypothetical protein
MPADVRKGSAFPSQWERRKGLRPRRGVALIHLRIDGRPEAFRTSSGKAAGSADILVPMRGVARTILNAAVFHFAPSALEWWMTTVTWAVGPGFYIARLRRSRFLPPQG